MMKNCVKTMKYICCKRNFHQIVFSYLVKTQKVTVPTRNLKFSQLIANIFKKKKVDHFRAKE